MGSHTDLLTLVLPSNNSSIKLTQQCSNNKSTITYHPSAFSTRTKLKEKHRDPVGTNTINYLAKHVNESRQMDILDSVYWTILNTLTRYTTKQPMNKLEFNGIKGETSKSATNNSEWSDIKKTDGNTTGSKHCLSVRIR